MRSSKRPFQRSFPRSSTVLLRRSLKAASRHLRRPRSMAASASTLRLLCSVNSRPARASALTVAPARSRMRRRAGAPSSAARRSLGRRMSVEPRTCGASARACACACPRGLQGGSMLRRRPRPGGRAPRREASGWTSSARERAGGDRGEGQGRGRAYESAGDGIMHAPRLCGHNRSDAAGPP